MNTINFQRNSNYNITRKTTSYSDSSGGTRYNVAYARHLDIPEKDILESKRFVAPESTCKPDHYDKKILCDQNEIEKALHADRISDASEEICSEAHLTDDQEAALRIMKILGVELRNEVNWESDGTGRLTAAQIEDLKSRYDVGNLDANEYCNLLVELVNLNVLSSDDLVRQFVHEVPPEVLRDGGMVYSSSDSLFSEYDKIWDRILLENETLDELLKAIDNRNTSLRESDINSVRRFYENERNSNLKIVDTLELLKR